MSFLENDRIQEWLVVLNDNFRSTKKIWLYILAGVLILSLPAFLILKLTFYRIALSDYVAPTVSRPIVNLLPLEVLEKKIIKLNNDTYSGFIRIKNLNLDWGVMEQRYVAVFKTLGGSEVTKVEGTIFILPASEKLIVFSRFTSDKEPSSVDFVLDSSKFTLKPQMANINMEVSRVEIVPSSSELIVSAVVKNTSPFSIKQVNLPVMLFNKNNEIVAVNFTSISEVRSLETRSFQFYWPSNIPGIVRAEISPEINIFDKSIFSTEPGKSPFDSFIDSPK